MRLRACSSAQSLFDHFGNQQIADAQARRTRAEHGNGLLFERKSGGADGGQQRAGGDGGGSLNVVVEGAEPVAIALQQDGRVDSGEVFPLQENVRPAALDGGHKLLDERVVLRAANALVLPADVDGVVEQRFVVRSHVEQNRQAVLRRNAAQRGVESHLADGDAHAAGALVAQAENALAVRDHDATHLVIARVGQNLLDAVLVRIAEEEAARPAPNLAEALAALAHAGVYTMGSNSSVWCAISE
jgi:hypothetical protein